jgi:5-(carboxyamino)imidazole ribonucleotide mutase
VQYEILISSAHRSPERTHEYVTNADERGAVCFICAAGMAAHLAGVVASLTIKPVIGVPMKGGLMDGLDALLSTVQMPAGIPVATVAVGKAGAMNAAMIAAQIVALNDKEVGAKLKLDRAAQAQKIEDDSSSIEKRL